MNEKIRDERFTSNLLQEFEESTMRETEDGFEMQRVRMNNLGSENNGSKKSGLQLKIRSTKTVRSIFGPK